MAKKKKIGFINVKMTQLLVYCFTILPKIFPNFNRLNKGISAKRD